MLMFKERLIPVSSEYYSKKVFERSVLLAERFQSTIHLVYIIEKKTLDQTDKLTDSFRTCFDIDETKKGIIREYKKKADSLIFADAQLLYTQKNINFTEEIVEGEFSAVVKSKLRKKKHDLILMGFEKECLLHYRLFDDVDIPIWIESGYEANEILAICSNLAPNQKVPEISMQLSKELGWNLDMIYIVDLEDAVVVDNEGRRSQRKTERELINEGKQFVLKMKQWGINVQLVKGSLEKETIKIAEESGVKLVILGREQKKKRILGLPVKSIKKKIAEKCRYSLLFMN